MSKSRAWCFTCQGRMEFAEWKGYFEEDGNVEYMVWQHEKAPTTGQIHAQGYLLFKNPRSFSGVQRFLFEGTHIEKRKGTHDQARDYCMKSETVVDGPYELGVNPVGQGVRSDLNLVTKLIDEGKKEFEYAQAAPEVFVRNFKGLRQYANVRKVRTKFEKPDVFYIWGKPGVGKTRSVYDKEGYSNVWTAPSGKWFDGYDHHEVVLFDDYYGGIEYSHFLRLLDGYPITVEVKGGFVEWCPKRIYITSNVPLEAQYGDIDYTALKRRINSVVNLTASNDMPSPIPPP